MFVVVGVQEFSVVMTGDDDDFVSRQVAKQVCL